MPHINSCYLNGRCTYKKNILKQKNRSPPTIADAPADENAPIEPQIRHDNPHFLQWFLKLHVHVAMCTCTCTHVHMYTCIHVTIHTHTHMYTHTLCVHTCMCRIAWMTHALDARTCTHVLFQTA